MWFMVRLLEAEREEDREWCKRSDSFRIINYPARLSEYSITGIPRNKLSSQEAVMAARRSW